MTESAVISPKSGIEISSSRVAPITPSSVRNFAAKVLAATSPTFGIPMAQSSLSSPRDFESAIAFMRFCADFSPIRSSPLTSSTESVYRSAALCIKSLSIRRSIICGPSPSIFMAFFEAKCSIERESCAGHDGFVHLTAAASSGA